MQVHGGRVTLVCCSVALLVLACGEVKPPSSPDGGSAPDSGNNPVSCIPGEIAACAGDDAMTCNASGDGYDPVGCDLGCSETPKPHCKYIEPRYLPDVCDSAATEDKLVVNGMTTLDPNLDSNCNGGVVSQAGAPAICVMRYRTIDVTENGQLKLTGKSDAGVSDTVGRAVALVADEQLSIAGLLDISADAHINGPGGGLVISGGRVELINADLHKAGGGAGGKTAGAPGGSTTTDGDGGVGGVATADPALSSALFGGAAAGRNTGPVTLGGGGGGGGATLISCRGNIAISGTIDAGGGGGTGGRALLGGDLPAWGGGAGGYVVIQAKLIDATGRLFANGGGGGTGIGTDINMLGADGADGLRSATMYAPGANGINGGGNGGRGGVGMTLPTLGGKSTATPTSSASPGGGGGSVGFLQVFTPMGIEPDLSTATASPKLQHFSTLKTR